MRGPVVGWPKPIEGRSWELQTVGFRNEYDAAFNRDGDLFTYDADMEWDINTPWYRPTRICFVASGAGFRLALRQNGRPIFRTHSLRSWTWGQVLPPGLRLAMARSSPKYQNAFLRPDWSYGKLYAVPSNLDGAGYRGTTEEFITGQPFPADGSGRQPEGWCFSTWPSVAGRPSPDSIRSPM